MAARHAAFALFLVVSTCVLHVSATVLDIDHFSTSDYSFAPKSASISKRYYTCPATNVIIVGDVNEAAQGVTNSATSGTYATQFSTPDGTEPYTLYSVVLRVGTAPTAPVASIYGDTGLDSPDSTNVIATSVDFAQSGSTSYYGFYFANAITLYQNTKYWVGSSNMVWTQNTVYNGSDAAGVVLNRNAQFDGSIWNVTEGFPLTFRIRICTPVSPSPSSSISPSISSSSSISPSPTTSITSSPSASFTNSPSASTSPSTSGSASPSNVPSPSPSTSDSSSPSASMAPSDSTSPLSSLSPSLSASATPSMSLLPSASASTSPTPVPTCDFVSMNGCAPNTGVLVVTCQADGIVTGPKDVAVEDISLVLSSDGSGLTSRPASVWIFNSDKNGSPYQAVQNFQPVPIPTSSLPTIVTTSRITYSRLNASTNYFLVVCSGSGQPPVYYNGGCDIAGGHLTQKGGSAVSATSWNIQTTSSPSLFSIDACPAQDQTGQVGNSGGSSSSSTSTSGGSSSGGSNGPSGGQNGGAGSDGDSKSGAARPFTILHTLYSSLSFMY